MATKIAFFLISIAVLTGCGGGSDNDAGPTIPVEYTTLNGTLRAPAWIEPTLLASPIRNTDSKVIEKYSSASVYVNNSPITSYSLTPIFNNPDWVFRISNVAKSANDEYEVKVVVGKIILKALVTEKNRNNFKIDTSSTAALILAKKTGLTIENLIASFPSFISDVEAKLEEAAKIEADKMPANLVEFASVTKEIESQNDFFQSIEDLNFSGRVAYLKSSNDLDGNGKEDVRVKTNLYGTKVRFETVLSSHTSALESATTLQEYSDERLLQDFEEGLTSNIRYIGPESFDFGLGMFFQKSASGDVYLKLIVKRIDLDQGEFKGAVVEYDFVKTETTAILTGSKTFMILGKEPDEGAVIASNFITDTDLSPYLLSYLSAENGIGSNDTRMVRAIVGQPELERVTAVEEYLEGGGNYFRNTSDALEYINVNRDLEVNDVFSVYFPSTRNYAIFKITWIGNDKITVNYIVNTAEAERYF
jgi:hypothetical protein